MQQPTRRTPARPAADQTSFLPVLAAAEAERRALIRGALAKLGVRERIAREIEGLCMYLDACAGDSGCQAYVRTLCRALGLTRRTLHRRLALAREHCLLRTQRARPGGPCINAVDWERVRAIAYGDDEPVGRLAPAAVREAAACDTPQRGSAQIATGTRCEKTGTRLSQTGTRLSQIGTTPNQQIATQPTTPEDSPSDAVTSAGDWDKATAAVASAGVIDLQRAMRQARGRGLTPADVLTIVVWWRSRVAASGWHSPAGMLVKLLRTADPKLLAKPPADAVAMRAAAARARDEPPAEPPMTLARCEALERLSADALADLAERVFADRPVLRRMYARAGLASPMCYEALAAAWSNDDGH